MLAMIPALAFGQIDPMKYMAILGVVAIAFAILVLLGIVVPPIAAVYLTDFFVLHRRDYSAAAGLESSLTNLNGLAACAAGAAVGLVLYYTHASVTGVPTIESFVSASVFYLIAEKLRDGAMRDRGWRTVRMDQ